MNQLANRAAWGAALCVAMGAASAGAHAAPAENAIVTPLPAQQVLRVSGVIGPAFEPDVRRALKRHPGIRRIDITSPGGMRAQAMRVGQIANRRGMTVRVDGRCASACALLWATAASREMTAGSRIGLHRSSLDPGLAVPDAVRGQLMRRNDRETDTALLKAGFPVEVVERGTATPPSTMAWFSAEQLTGVPFVLLDRRVATTRVAGGAPHPAAASALPTPSGFQAGAEAARASRMSPAQ